LWTASGWSASANGLALMACSASYALLVGFGGMLAERIGRARVSMLGASIGAVGCAVAWIHPHPLTALVSSMLAFGGPALYFPGCAGLVSDLEHERGATPIPLHRKLSQYNLGWAGGCLLAFFTNGFLSAQSLRLGYAITAIAFAAVALMLAPWRRLPPSPPAAHGDRADHPALGALTLMSRLSLLFAAMLGLSMIAVLERTLTGRVADPRQCASWTLTAYACGYIAMFTLLGRWGGWVLRPWRLVLVQLGYLVASSVLVIATHAGILHPGMFIAVGALIGIAYGATYTGSIYYSVRIPQGASRAASLHETFLGVGNTLGPILGGLSVDALVSWSGGSVVPVTALAVFLVAISVATLVIQLVSIPRLPR
jgi:MFS family permease